MQTNREFSILEPLLDSYFIEDKSTTLSLDNVELGEFHITESSLIYYSPSGLIESLVFNYEDYPILTIGDYTLILFEFCAHLFGEAYLLAPHANK
jgi:hypothetical protein